MPIHLACEANLDQIAQLYARVGRVHICPALDPQSAEKAYRSLQQEVPWQLHLNDGEKSFDLAQEQIRLIPEATQVMLHERVHANAQQGFQYLFDNFPLSDAHALQRNLDLYAMRVFEFLNSERFLNFARRATGRADIAFADAQATAYRPGHFLTQHDDSATGKERIAAYVLNLTPRWHADWGGILNFLDADGHVAEGYTPVFNALNLFKVPQPHTVSYVTPFAQGIRYSITGWLRAK
jgi:Rps23 Pro-64 3,4-dihydroxylase Tpa1-like proline 4-hydroxylase